MEIRELLLPGNTYHVCTRSNGTDLLFRDKEDYVYFREAMKKRLSGRWEIIAWTLVPNEIHLVISIKANTEVDPINQSNFFGHLLNGYVQHYNRKYHRQGSLFNRSFRRKLIKSEKELKDLICMVDNLAVARNLVADQDDWEFASFYEFQQSNYVTKTARKVAEKFKGIIYYIVDHLREEVMKKEILPPRKWFNAWSCADPLGMKEEAPP